MDFQDLKNMLGDNYRFPILVGSYSGQEKKKMEEALNTKGGKALVKLLKTEYDKFAVVKTKEDERIKKIKAIIDKAAVPVESQLKKLREFLNESIKDSEDSFLREGVESIMKKILTKCGIKGEVGYDSDMDDEGDTIYIEQIDFKSKAGKDVHIEFTFQTDWYDEDLREEREVKNPEFENIEVTYDGKKVRCTKSAFRNANKKTALSVYPKFFEDLYTDELDYFMD